MGKDNLSANKNINIDSSTPSRFNCRESLLESITYPTCCHLKKYPKDY